MPEMLTTRPKCRVFPGRKDQVAQARDFVRRTLGPCPVLDEAVLLVSELATNAPKTHLKRSHGELPSHHTPWD
ncbi:MAG: hypothetical protein ACRDNZ_24605, partial [Streptosporangiaceae bacterium]